MPDLAAAKILVADDDQSLVRTLTWILKENGYEVVVAPGGEGLMGKLEEERPHLLLLDIMMPKVDGLQLLAKMKADERFRDLPVLMISSMPPEEATVKSLGLGPLQPLMADPDISDILVNRFDEIYIERRGRLEFVSNAFRDEAQLEQVIQKIVALVGREINIEKPLVDARMVDGSRANAVYAPVGGPTLCIRKFNRVRLALLPDEHDSSVASWAMWLHMRRCASATERAGERPRDQVVHHVFLGVDTGEKVVPVR